VQILDAVRRKIVTNAKTVVIKVGASILTLSNGEIDIRWIKNFVSQVCYLLGEKRSVMIVSSGAIGAGMGLLGFSSRPGSLPELQAAAAVGQSRLMKVYDEAFAACGYPTAQVLLTREDMSSRKRYLNARNTLLTLLKLHVVPIINENDTVSVDEIRFGDNDCLSGLVASLTEADLLVILSDVDGLYTKNPEDGAQKGELIRVVHKVTSDIEEMAFGTSKNTSVGGMATKIGAARIVTSSGIPMIIANGRKDNILKKLMSGDQEGTLFVAHTDRLLARKRWIAHGSRTCGRLVVDRGARDALLFRGKSLLASGVTGVAGKFDTGDVVSIADESGREFARGLASYSSEDVAKIKGLKTSQIQPVLGYKYYDELVHRNNMVILKTP
jgi:glutamate 5-kinase